MPFNDSESAKAANARGRKRQAELAAEMKHAVAVNSAAMIAGLGRDATPAEVFTAEAIAALFLRARRVRESGRDDSDLLRQAASITNASVFRSSWILPASEIHDGLENAEN